jgi:heme o synthase
VNAETASIESEVQISRGRAADYLALTKPRVVLMVLCTTLAGFYLGTRGGFDFLLAFNLLIGTALAAGGTLALNQYVERDIDALMQRTCHRPLPDGRMRPAEALWFGLGASLAGLAYLAVTANWLCAVLTGAISVVYLLGYTPLKRVSWLCDLVGAIPGALPPLAGWAAGRGDLALEPILIFAIMFLWQLAHTFAVARLYRTDYARAGIRLLPADNTRGHNLSDAIVLAASFALVVAGVTPRWFGYAGDLSAVAGAALGAAMLACAIAMVRAPARAAAARRLLYASLFYLPIILLVLVLDRI